MLFVVFFNGKAHVCYKLSDGTVEDLGYIYDREEDAYNKIDSLVKEGWTY